MLFSSAPAPLSPTLVAEYSVDSDGLTVDFKITTFWQANLLGFPNAFIGLVTEPVVITVAVAALGGVRFPRWFMVTAQAFYSVGFAFAYWLFFQSYFVIGALCPWCLTITVTTTLVFFSITRVNILEGNLRFGRVTPTVQTAVRGWIDVYLMVAILATFAVMVAVRYL